MLSDIPCRTALHTFTALLMDICLLPTFDFHEYCDNKQGLQMSLQDPSITLLDAHKAPCITW